MSGTVRTLAQILAEVPTGGPAGGITPVSFQDIVATLAAAIGMGQPLQFPIGTVWYVDNTAVGSNDGTSWFNAWNSLASINWSLITAGATIYISGGVSGQTYSDAPLTVGASGSSSAPIIISGAFDKNHNGPAIIDGTTSSIIFSNSNVPVSFNNHTNVTVQNLTVQNCLETCVYMGQISSGTIIMQNCIIHTGMAVVPLVTTSTTALGNGTLTFAGGVPAQIYNNAASGFAVVDHTNPAALVSPSYTTSGTSTTLVVSPVAAAQVQIGDTIYVAYNGRGVKIEGNTGGTVIFRNNYVDTPSNTPAQTDAIFSDVNVGGVVQVLNNIVIVYNVDPSGHSDCYQNTQDNCALTVAGNFFAHPNGGVNNHGVLLADIGTGQPQNFYNNIIVMGQSSVYANGDPEYAMLLQILTAGYTGTANVYNNTIVGGGLSSVQIYEPNGFHATWNIKNNIIYPLLITQTPYNLEAALGSPAVIDYNDVYFPATNLRTSYVTGSGVGGVRSTTSHAINTGSWYFEYQYGYTLTSQSTMIGIGNSSASLTVFVGSDTNSVGYDWGNGGIYFNGSHTVIQLAAVYNRIAVAVSLASTVALSKIWFKNLTTGSGWNNDVIGNQNPATNTGGFALTGMAAGPYFVMTCVGGVGDHVVFNFGGSAFTGTIPSGFSAWGAATTLNPADIAAPCTLTPPIAVIGSTQETWAAWQGLGYDVHGVNANPLFTAVGQYTIQTGSAAKNAGLTIAGVATDFAGYTRPQGTSYCMGAYEFPL